MPRKSTPGTAINMAYTLSSYPLARATPPWRSNALGHGAVGEAVSARCGGQGTIGHGVLGARADGPAHGQRDAVGAKPTCGWRRVVSSTPCGPVRGMVL